MADRYAREYVCPDPAEHGEIVYVPGLLHWNPWGRRDWQAMADIPTCQICGLTMVHDVDRPPDLEIILVHRNTGQVI